MNYEIIATLGPASSDTTIWSAIRSAGASAFRLNTSHLSLADLQDWLERLEPFLSAQEEEIPLVLDLQGSKWRLGSFVTCTLQPGEQVRLVLAETSERSATLPVPHADFFRAAGQGAGELVMNDARIRLHVEQVRAEEVTARVVTGGSISSRKGITFRDNPNRVEALGEKDRSIFRQTRGLAFVRYAISYLKDAAEMAHYQALFAAETGADPYLIAKLERDTAMQEGRAIAAHAHELWVCRGDLGAEVGLPAMAQAVHRFSQEMPTIEAPVIMAGQVLEHMTAALTPTRSETCYLYDALAAGYRGFVLSDETAVGRYPIESCQVAAMFRTGFSREP